MPSSLTDSFLNGLTQSVHDGATLRRLGTHQGKQELYTKQRPEALTSLKQRALVESVESSNRIEGITAPADRVKQLALFTTAPSDRPEQEIAGYRDALALIHESATDMPFRGNVILHLHTLINRYQPDAGGRWKQVDNEIVEKDEAGRIVRVRFKAVPAVNTPQAIDDLVRGYDRAITARGIDPLLIIPLTILDFLCIHPFADGNGRMARLLTLQLLYRNDHQVGRYISLERIFEETKETYYETLERSSTNWHTGEHDPMPWVRYFWGALLRAYATFEERLGPVTRARGAKRELVRQAAIRRTLPFHITELEQDCPGVSRELIRRVLRTLRDEGAMVAEGRGRGARWRPTPKS